MFAVYTGSPGFYSQYHVKVGAVVLAWPAFKSCQRRIRPSRWPSTAQPVQGQPELFDRSPRTPFKKKEYSLRPSFTLSGHRKSTSTDFSLVFFKAGLDHGYKSTQKHETCSEPAQTQEAHGPCGHETRSCSHELFSLPTNFQMALPVTTKLLHGRVDLGSHCIANSCSEEIMCDILDLHFLHTEQWLLFLLPA